MVIDIPQKQEKQEILDMPQRIRKTVWKEPKRKHPPEWTLENARKYLAFKHVESVRQLVERGPGNNGLQGYIRLNKEDDIGGVWIPKHGTGHAGVAIFLYPEDVKAWGEANVRSRSSHDISKVSYTEKEKQEILETINKYALEHPEIACNAETGHGAVNRSGLQKLLINDFGPRWESRGYPKIKAVLDKEGYPLLPGRTDTSIRRRRIV